MLLYPECSSDGILLEDLVLNVKLPSLLPVVERPCTFLHQLLGLCYSTLSQCWPVHGGGCGCHLKMFDIAGPM